MLKLRPEQWHALSPHLDQMLGMRDEERSTWLSSLRERNPMLVRQLESLLHEHRRWSTTASWKSVRSPFPAGRHWLVNLLASTGWFPRSVRGE
jgi:hypothetical protein